MGSKVSATTRPLAETGLPPDPPGTPAMCPAMPPSIGSTAEAEIALPILRRTAPCARKPAVSRGAIPRTPPARLSYSVPSSVFYAASMSCNRTWSDTRLCYHLHTQVMPANHNPAPPARAYPVSCISDLPHIRVNAWIDQHYPQGEILLALSPDLSLIMRQKELHTAWC